ncbi:MAG: STAS domain-containing protein [Oscillospiraceae bacterium]|jgi:stage II sporulation protein AA (anti-sigma F factor antagonist)|nr:STAS domain-containing protein [Oscillospiraceae bacterium]
MTHETIYDSGQLRIKLKGELDHHAAKGIMESIASAVDIRLPRSCVLDFSGVNFMDSSGIAVIMRTKRRMDELDGAFAVEGLCAQPLKVLSAAGIARTLTVK